MLQKSLDSFKNNIRQKMINPFFGTLIIVWVVRNWELVYGVFTFDEYFTFNERMTYIQKHFKDEFWDWNSFYGNLLCCVIITLITIIFSYIFLGLSRFISEFYNKIILPEIYKRINSKESIVLKSEYQKLEKINEKLERRVSDERQARIDSEDELEKTQKLLTEQNTKNQKLSNDLSEAQNDFIELQRSLERPPLQEENYSEFTDQNFIPYPTTPEIGEKIKFPKTFNYAVNINLADDTNVKRILSNLGDKYVCKWESNSIKTNYLTLTVLKTTKQDIDVLLMEFERVGIDFRNGKILK